MHFNEFRKLMLRVTCRLLTAAWSSSSPRDSARLIVISDGFDKVIGSRGWERLGCTQNVRLTSLAPSTTPINYFPFHWSWKMPFLAQRTDPKRHWIIRKHWIRSDSLRLGLTTFADLPVIKESFLPFVLALHQMMQLCNCLVTWISH